MMKPLLKKLVLSLSLLIVVLLVSNCNSHSTSQFGVEDPEDPNIVAQIDQYVFTRAELEDRLLQEIIPNPYNDSVKESGPVEAKEVLLEMIAEKAMIIEARQQGHLEDEKTYTPVKIYKEKNLRILLLQNYLKDVEDKVIVTEAEIEKRLQADPNSSRDRVKLILANAKKRQLISQYYKQLLQKFHAKKLSENYPKAIKIHNRLLNQPKTPQRMKFIRKKQIAEEMTPEERSIVLATFDNGQVTLEDWLKTLCEYSPPSRPKNLNTTKGVEQLLNNAIMLSVYLTEAKLQNLDKDEEFLKKLRAYEDRILSSKVKSDMYKKIEKPTDEEINDYFNSNKKAFRSIKIDQIWCEDLKTARQVKKELDEGKDFESAKQEYSLNKKRKASTTSPKNQGLFWKDLWKADPNDIIGPIKGFYGQQIKWRIVKILEKKPGKEFSEDIKGIVKDSMMSDRREATMTDYGRRLLKKYPYKIYTSRIKNIDPLDIQ
jgi:hypothetical protein